MLRTSPLRECKCGTTAYTEEELELFKPRKDCKYGRSNQCKECHSSYELDRYNRGDKREQQVLKHYGITLEEYNVCMQTSDRCEVCGTTSNLCYDHCHDTMKFRGVLCASCNVSLGQLGDNLEGIMRVVKYLSKV